MRSISQPAPCRVVKTELPHKPLRARFRCAHGAGAESEKQVDRARHTLTPEFTEREEATRTEESFLLVPAGAGDGAGFGMLG